MLKRHARRRWSRWSRCHRRCGKCWHKGILRVPSRPRRAVTGAVGGTPVAALASPEESTRQRAYCSARDWMESRQAGCELPKMRVPDEESTTHFRDSLRKASWKSHPTGSNVPSTDQNRGHERVRSAFLGLPVARTRNDRTSEFEKGCPTNSALPPQEANGHCSWNRSSPERQIQRSSSLQTSHWMNGMAEARPMISNAVANVSNGYPVTLSAISRK